VVIGIVGFLDAPSDAEQPPPDGRDHERGALWQRRHAVAVERRLAAEDDRPARPQHALELGERGVEVRMWWRTAWPSTRSNESSSKGSSAASQRTVSTARPRLSAERDSWSSIPWEMSVATASSTAPGAQQVEREVPGARADLERARERAAVSAECLAHLPEYLLDSALVVRDSPLRVVIRSGDVVVAGVHILDVVVTEAGHGGGI